MTTRAPTPLPRPVADVVDTAVGSAHRHDPVLAGTGGPAGNALLTAWVGLVLLVALAVEGVTLVSLQRLVGVHIFVGVLLVPIALLKTATTTWRMLRYYLGNAAYREAGPPPMLLRLLGPAVVLTTLAVLGTGLALIAVGRGDHVLFLHKATFVLWFAVTTLHTLARLVPALAIVGGRRLRHLRVPGVAMRAAVVTVAIAAGVVAGLIVLPRSGYWTHQLFGPE